MQWFLIAWPKQEIKRRKERSEILRVVCYETI